MIYLKNNKNKKKTYFLNLNPASLIISTLLILKMFNYHKSYLEHIVWTEFFNFLKVHNSDLWFNKNKMESTHRNISINNLYLLGKTKLEGVGLIFSARCLNFSCAFNLLGLKKKGVWLIDICGKTRTIDNTLAWC